MKTSLSIPIYKSHRKRHSPHFPRSDSVLLSRMSKTPTNFKSSHLVTYPPTGLQIPLSPTRFQILRHTPFSNISTLAANSCMKLVRARTKGSSGGREAARGKCRFWRSENEAVLIRHRGAAKIGWTRLYGMNSVFHIMWAAYPIFMRMRHQDSGWILWLEAEMQPR
jgi:hypothetical protein